MNSIYFKWKWLGNEKQLVRFLKKWSTKYLFETFMGALFYHYFYDRSKTKWVFWCNKFSEIYSRAKTRAKTFVLNRSKHFCSLINQSFYLLFVFYGSLASISIEIASRLKDLCKMNLKNGEKSINMWKCLLFLLQKVCKITRCKLKTLLLLSLGSSNSSYISGCEIYAVSAVCRLACRPRRIGAESVKITNGITICSYATGKQGLISEKDKCSKYHVKVKKI